MRNPLPPTIKHTANTQVSDILGNLSGIFSGILAFAFDTVSGKHGLSGWQWLFLAEGVMTITLGIAVKFLLPDCE
jgi:hypothetical protein